MRILEFEHTVRTYGNPPYRVAVIHGGPGAPGSVAPVARELVSKFGVLEPFQTADSVEGQIQELEGQLRRYADLPVALIGHSWGAMLSYMFAARYPDLVSKLILVASGSFSREFGSDIVDRTRMSRLTEAERLEAAELMEQWRNPESAGSDDILARLGELFRKTDAYDPLPIDPEPIQVQFDINTKVWAEAKKLRDSGKMLAMGRQIRCPVVAIHGDYDSHPAEGVEGPLAGSLKDFRFVLLRKCGHEPWTERHSRERFFRILMRELRRRNGQSGFLDSALPRSK